MLLMSLSLLFQLCQACIVHLIWMVCEMRGKCPYNCYFIGYCFQDLFKTACSILVLYPFSFSFRLFVRTWVVHPYNSTTTTWKKKNLFYQSDQISIWLTICPCFIYVYIASSRQDVAAEIRELVNLFQRFATYSRDGSLFKNTWKFYLHSHRSQCLLLLTLSYAVGIWLG